MYNFEEDTKYEFPLLMIMMFLLFSLMKIVGTIDWNWIFIVSPILVLSFIIGFNRHFKKKHEEFVKKRFTEVWGPHGYRLESKTNNSEDIWRELFLEDERRHQKELEFFDKELERIGR